MTMEMVKGVGDGVSVTMVAGWRGRGEGLSARRMAGAREVVWERGSGAA